MPSNASLCQLINSRLSSDLTGSLRIARHNLDLVGKELGRSVSLELDILDQERPDIVAESVRLEMTLVTV